ncbi:MAG: RagB/SusD family nutrient uptake outer membrane protein [Parabacteroides sp.]|nr:RagB/SusD family nutrient uptake outer membrane protein [Parabacteroides sp.]
MNNVISSGQYGLLSNFADVFSVDNKNNKESIFEVQFDKTIEGQGYMGGDPLITGSDVNNLPSDNLLKLFEENQDDRKDASVIDLGVQGWRLYKWHDTKGTNNGMGFNIMVLRYADVLLMAAEIMNEIGYGQPQALEYLNQIRKRSHATEYTSSDLPDQETFRTAITKERRLELAFENHRWFDLLRTGKAIEVLNKMIIRIMSYYKFWI